MSDTSDDLLAAAIEGALSDPGVVDGLAELDDDENAGRAAVELQAAIEEAAEDVLKAAADDLQRLDDVDASLAAVVSRAERRHELAALGELDTTLPPLLTELEQMELQRARTTDAIRGVHALEHDRQFEAEAMRAHLVEIEAGIRRREVQLRHARSQIEPRVTELMNADPDVAAARNDLKIARTTAQANLQERGTLDFARRWIGQRVQRRHSHALTITPRGLGQQRDPRYDVSTEAHRALEGITERLAGGSIGISGPRGCGKTTLIQRICARDQTVPPRAFSVTVSAPVHYDARDFILHLFSSVCRAVAGSAADETAGRSDAPRPERLLTGAHSMALAVGAAMSVSGLVVAGTELARMPLRSDAALIVCASLVVLVGLFVWPLSEAASTNSGARRRARSVPWLVAGLGLLAIGALVYAALWYSADWKAWWWEVAVGVAVWLVAVLGLQLLRWPGVRPVRARLLLLSSLSTLVPLVMFAVGAGGVAVAIAWSFISDRSGGAAWAAAGAWGAAMAVLAVPLWLAGRRQAVPVLEELGKAAASLLGAAAVGLIVAAAADESVAAAAWIGTIVLACTGVGIAAAARALAPRQVIEDVAIRMAREAVQGVLSALAIAALTAGTALVGLAWLGRTVNATLALGVAIAVAGGIVVRGAITLRRSINLERDSASERARLKASARPELVKQALAHLEEIRYLLTHTSGWSGTLKLAASSHLPVGVEAGVTGGRSMAEQPRSLPEVVSMYMSFVEDAGKDGAVLIGIDELDKIGSDSKARDFLNDLKSVFDVRGAYYLVSVSEDAVASFERRGLPIRDVFDSSFDEIIRIDHLGYQGAGDILRGRLVDPPDWLVGLCYCLSGGLPRDLIRFARWTFQLRDRYEEKDRYMPALARGLADKERAAKRAATVAAISAISHGPASRTVVRWLSQLDMNAPPTQPLQPPAIAELDDETADAERDRILGLCRLLEEYVAYDYFLTTVTQFFDDSLTAEHLETATKPGVDYRSLQCLAEARQSFALDPWLAWTRITTFRTAWGLAGRPQDWPFEPRSDSAPHEAGGGNGAGDPEGQASPA